MDAAKRVQTQTLRPILALAETRNDGGQSSQQIQSGMYGEPIAERTLHPQTLNVEDILCELILLYFFT